MNWIGRIVLFFLLWLSVPVYAGTLNYDVEGVRGTLAKNIRAWLGDEPETVQQRSAFLARLDERLSKSLQAVGYYHPTIETHIDKSHSAWQLSIVVRPNNPVLISSLDVRLTGAAREDAQFKELLANNPLLVGQKLNHDEYESFKNALLSLGQRRGYFDGKFSSHIVKVDPQHDTASIGLVYDSGHRYQFGELQFDAESLDADLVDSLRTFRQGDQFDLGLIQKFQAQLQQTRYFAGVLLTPRLQNATAYAVPISLKVYPASRHKVDVGAGFSTETRERVSLTWRSPKLNRYGHSQETRLEYSSINPSGRISYNIPLTHPLNDVLQLSVRLEDNEFGDIDSQQKELAVSREVKRAQGWISSYFVRTLKESWAVNEQHNDNAYLLPGMTLSHKRRRGLLVDPVAGFSQLYRAEGGSDQLGSDINLLRLYGNFTYVATLAPRHRLLTRAELGAVFIDEEDRKDLAPSLGFFAGGSQSIRGYSYQSLGNEVLVTTRDDSPLSLTIGGDRLLVGSVEYQYYVNDSWRGAVFIDAGDAFDVGDFDLNVGAGFGVHYLTPVGAIKFEVANSVSEDDPSWRFHINIGAEF